MTAFHPVQPFAARRNHRPSWTPANGSSRPSRAILGHASGGQLDHKAVIHARLLVMLTTGSRQLGKKRLCFFR
jgi:hypothetical protein